jgi:hypothetical protein
MRKLSAVLREPSPGRVAFWCPGCDDMHAIPVAPEQQPNGAWGWDGDVKRPTFAPSLLVRSGHYAEAGGSAAECKFCNWSDEEKAEWGGSGCVRCHTFVRGGMIEFLGDCTHALAGQTVPIPQWPEGRYE